LCLDFVQDSLIAACHDVIKVFDMDDFHLVQTNYGHLFFSDLKSYFLIFKVWEKMKQALKQERSFDLTTYAERL